MEALQRDAPPRHRAVDPPLPWEMAYLAALERFGVPSLWAVKSIRELIPCCVLVDRGVPLQMGGTGLPDRFHHLADASFSAYVFDSDVSVWPPLLPPLKGNIPLLPDPTMLAQHRRQIQRELAACLSRGGIHNLNLEVMGEETAVRCCRILVKSDGEDEHAFGAKGPPTDGADEGHGGLLRG
jgi:hypothetical protein